MNIAQYRMLANMTQAQLAERMNVARSTIAMWETGANQPRAIDISNLADILGVTTDELLGRITPAPTDRSA